MLVVGSVLLFLEMIVSAPYRREQRRLYDKKRRNLMRLTNPHYPGGDNGYGFVWNPEYLDYEAWEDSGGRDKARAHNELARQEYRRALEEWKAQKKWWQIAY